MADIYLVGGSIIGVQETYEKINDEMKKKKDEEFIVCGNTGNGRKARIRIEDISCIT